MIDTSFLYSFKLLLGLFLFFSTFDSNIIVNIKRRLCDEEIIYFLLTPISETCGMTTSYLWGRYMRGTGGAGYLGLESLIRGSLFTDRRVLSWSLYFYLQESNVFLLPCSTYYVFE